MLLAVARSTALALAFCIPRLLCLLAEGRATTIRYKAKGLGFNREA
jgi:hypothetical protein